MAGLTNLMVVTVCIVYRFALQTHMSLGANVLERVLSEFQHSLNVQELMPCLRLAGLLTDDDCSEVAVDPEDPPESAVRMLTSVLKRKGPHCANMLLSALEQSVVGLSASHNIYFQLIECLQQELMMAGLLMGSSAMDQTQNSKQAFSIFAGGRKDVACSPPPMNFRCFDWGMIFAIMIIAQR